MLDLKWLVDNLEEAKKNLGKRNFDSSILDEIVDLDRSRRDLIQKDETLRSRRNQISKEIAQKKRNQEDASDLMAESKHVNTELDSMQDYLATLKDKLNNKLLGIPNRLHESVPAGKDENDNTLLKTIGEIPNYNFEPKDHHDLGEKLGIIDFEAGIKIAGARFATLNAQGAKLNRAIIQFFLDLHTEQHGYQEIVPPFIVNSNSLIGTGQLPKFSEDLFHLNDTDYYLNPTSEVMLTNIHRDEILTENKLPYQFTAYSPCFRSEAGSYGRDTRGLIRQHQFEKVELVWLTHPDQSWEAHESLLNHAEKALEFLELPYRVMTLCGGDIGFGAAKCYDLEVWLPSQKQYREISSCSNCLDFQARRANIRFRPQGGGKPQFVHSLNGSGLAVGRTLLAILENYQQEDGSIEIPKVLQKYTGFDRIESK